MSTMNEELVFVNKIWDILCETNKMDVTEIENGLERLTSHIRSSEKLLQMHYFMMQIASETDMKGVGLLTLNTFHSLANPYGCSLFIYDDKEDQLKEFLSLSKRKCEGNCKRYKTLVEDKISGMSSIETSCDCSYDYVKAFPIYNREGNILGYIVGYYDGKEYDLNPEIQMFIDIFMVQIGLSLESVILKDKMEVLAYTDELTGLSNKRVLISRLEEGILRTVQSKLQGKAHKGVGVILYDVDNFKHYNDTYGHVAGDDVLRTLGKIIRKHVGDDYIGARYGGEELCVIMNDVSYDDAMILAEKIRKAIDDTSFEFRKVTVSGGVTHYPTINKADTKELLNTADIALYASKNTSKNKVTKFLEQDKENEKLQVKPSLLSSLKIKGLGKK